MPVIDKALPKQRERVKHHASMPYAEVPAFLRKLRERESMGRLALEAVILTATRSGEVRLAQWVEIDLDARTWTIPAEKMKAGREHVVPLSDAAVRFFERMKAHKRGDCDLVFPGQRRAKPLSDMTLTKAMRDAGLAYTAHGFRTSFRTWAGEQTSYPREVAEAAIAHVNKDKVEAAYLRTDFFDKRRALMQAWADYCEGTGGGNVVRLAS